MFLTKAGASGANMLLGGMAVVGLARSGVPGSFAVASSAKGVVEWSAGLSPDAHGAKV